MCLACIVGVIFGISRLVLRRHRGPKAPHDIKGFEIPRHGEELVHKHAGGHEAGGVRRSVSVKVGFPVPGAAGPGGLALVGGPLKLEEDGVGGSSDVLGAFQRGEDALVTPGELLEQKTDLCLQVPHGPTRRPDIGQEGRLAGLIGPLCEAIPRAVPGEIGIGSGVHGGSIGGVC